MKETSGSLRIYVATYLISAGHPWVRFFLLSGALHKLPEVVLFLMNAAVCESQVRPVNSNSALTTAVVSATRSS